MSEAADDVAVRIWKLSDKRRAARSSVFDPNWQNISQYFYPEVSDINTDKTESTTDWFQRIYDSSPMQAADTCSIGVRNWVTPSTEPWLGLSPPSNLGTSTAPTNPRMRRLNPNAPEPDEQGQDDATRWLSYAAEELSQGLSGCNFYSVIQPFNKGACTFGTALLLCEEGKADVFMFEQFKVGTFTVAENDQKIVDTVDRWLKLTVRQAVQKFCKKREDGTYETGNLPGRMVKAYNAQKFDDMFTFVHHVLPMEDYRMLGGEVSNELGASEMAFASIYQEDSSKKIVRSGGYEEMPYFCLRWARWGTEDQVWGVSPGFVTLPEARQINFVTQYQDALAELKANPRVLSPDNLDGDIQMAAGGVTTVPADQLAKGEIPKEWLTGGDSGEIIAMIERKEKAINKAFFVDVFNALGMLMDKKMTATEVTQRIGEKLDQFTGTFDQYTTELINPLVRRCLGIMMRSGRLREPPQSLMVKPGNDPKALPELAVPKVVINSRVTLAIKAVRNAGVQNTLDTLAPIAEGRPDIWDNFNLDSVSRGVGRNFGMPENMFNSMKRVIELRDARAKMQQQQHAADMAEKLGKAGGALGRAPEPMQKAVMEQFPKSG